ncbi:MAG TPA: Rho termination factor N-terminal domain-containing protein [Ignavibacteriales bacterium]|nr:Rho termination factor N-terminal domain-containing protein [Ignavibacteriales bacterium]
MLCEKCNKEFSDSVYPLHIGRCKGAEGSWSIGTPVDVTLNTVPDYSKMKVAELKELAKAAGHENADTLTKTELIELLTPKEN